MGILQINDLSFHYPDETEYVLKQVSLTIEAGEFVVLCGSSGSGKTTLLRLIKNELAPYGKRTGEILYVGRDVTEWDDRTLASEIGFVFQNPDNQIVMDEVLHEIVFGMENLNISHIEMKKRLSELVHFFGVDELLTKKTHHLSGGQKQLVNLLSTLLLRPKILLLDEPTSQLDPVAAKELLQILERLNNEMGMTIIIVEHRLEELFSIADRVIMLDEGKIIYEGSSRQVIYDIYSYHDVRFIPYVPSVSRLYLEKEEQIEIARIPINVKESRQWMMKKTPNRKLSSEVSKDTHNHVQNNVILTLDKVYFQYERDLPFVLKNCSLTVHEGEFFALVGGNGSGKSTLLQLSMGIRKPQRGKVKYKNKVLKKYSQEELVNNFGYLPQHPLAFYPPFPGGSSP